MEEMRSLVENLSVQMGQIATDLKLHMNQQISALYGKRSSLQRAAGFSKGTRCRYSDFEKSCGE